MKRREKKTVIQLKMRIMKIWKVTEINRNIWYDFFLFVEFVWILKILVSVECAYYFILHFCFVLYAFDGNVHAHNRNNQFTATTINEFSSETNDNNKQSSITFSLNDVFDDFSLMGNNWTEIKMMQLLWIVCRSIHLLRFFLRS